MFKYLMKSLVAEYIFAGYSVRKGTAVLSKKEGNVISYDKFSYTYIDNFLSFYILMDDGLYLNVDTNERVPLLNAEDLMSKHLGPNENFDSDIDRDKVIGVFGVRNMDTLIKQVDDMNVANDAKEVRLKGVIEPKKSYYGMEVNTTIGMFNKATKRVEGFVTVPPLVYGPEDTYKSILGDEIDFYDFMSNKEADAIIDDLAKLNDSIDGVGNVKEGTEIIINKGTEGAPASVIINQNNQ